MSNGAANPTPILLPQVGNSMEEGTILAWKKQVGDQVKPGDVLYELETDKATIEIEAEASGRLAKILVGDGQTAPIQAMVAILAQSDAEAEAFLGSSGAQIDSGLPAPKASVQTAPATMAESRAAQPHESTLAPSRQRISPAARNAAGALGVDLGAIPHGSGPGGRVVRADVEARASAPQTAHSGRAPMSKMRRAIARNMQLSQQTVPHFYVRLTIDAAPLEAAYRKAKAQFPCSINDLIVAAVARAVMEFPQFRQQAEGDFVTQQSGANIGIAVGVEEGLVVPVLMGAERLSLQGLADQARRIVGAAREGKIEGMGQGVFTISNLGMFGVEEFAAIVNPPESGILAVGAIRESVQVQGGALKPGKAMTMTLSVDHRVVDGVLAAKFMARLKELLEAPASLGA